MITRANGTVARLRRMFGVLLLVAVFTFPALAQNSRSFTPLPLYSGSSKELIRKVRTQLDAQCRELNGNAIFTSQAGDLCQDRTELIMRMIRAKSFIEYAPLENLLHDIVDEIVQKNKVDERNRVILLLNSPEVNAFCFGRGVYVVTIGLLSRLHSRDELAFTLCHELAHDELSHVEERILREVNLKVKKKSTQFLRKLVKGEVDSTDISAARNILYATGKFSRENELEADSMGYQLFKRFSFQEHEAITALQTLDSAYQPKYDARVGFFAPLNSSKYPFESAWLRETAKTQVQEPQEYLFSSDSLQSHPDLQVRIAALYEKLGAPKIHTQSIDPEFFSQVIHLAEFQAVEAARLSRRYDQCLFLIMQLWQKYPHHSFLVSRAGKVLVDMYDIKRFGLSFLYAARYVSNYGERLQQVNRFVHNINGIESLELAYHLVNNQSNFDRENASHYYLLWKICQTTDRKQTAEKISTAFRDKFEYSITNYQFE